MSAPTMPLTERMTCSQARAETSTAVLPLCEGLPRHQARRLHEDALLIASELAANALRHGGGITRFSACVHGRDLVVQVSDRSSRPPRLVPHDPAMPGGFGWLMVRNLAGSVTVEQHGDGKTITAVLARPRPEPASG
ncbi:ATP-binding protein [Streptomyces kunmingensis]|uniref:ATP-binding protein n=1 Tax=Streptomyces kunmingensis TaxID=68225 RepID=A0ABU6C8R5_9ACTN|nr:ATP-binding protein [Streptomyces kunmingensis]MEB3961033.1 ATP-binding protein [Streptomyces kunmingensis]